MQHPVLVLIRGLPGSGKTHLAAKLKDALNSEGVVMLDPDATDYNSQEYARHTEQLTADGVDPKLHAYRFLRAQAHRGIEGHKIIIWNQPFTNLDIFNKMVANLTNHAAEHHTTLPILVVEVEVDLAVAKQRIESRKSVGGHGPSDNTFSRFVNDYKSFASEGYTTVTVYGTDDVNKSLAKVLRALEDLNS